MNQEFIDLKSAILQCRLCEKHLPLGPRPVFQVNPEARILIAGQAPGRKVHESGIPFDDASGNRLREWLGIGRDRFYDAGKIAILPMGFCFPGSGKSGDLPPRPECAETWHGPLLQQLHQVKLTIVLGQYARRYHMPSSRPITQQARDWRSQWPHRMLLPHPSPRNNGWLKKNAWFEQELLPVLQKRVSELLQ